MHFQYLEFSQIVTRTHFEYSKYPVCGSVLVQNVGSVSSLPTSVLVAAGIRPHSFQMLVGSRPYFFIFLSPYKFMRPTTIQPDFCPHMNGRMNA